MIETLNQSLMLREAAQAPAVCAAQVAANRDAVARATARLRALDPPFVATLARGSSDHAAAFAKALFETHLHLPVLSHAPSTGALFRATAPSFRNVPLIAISQSGRSPDILRASEDAQRAGAIVVAMVNDETSPLAALADIVIPLRAGPETAVAATKSFLASLAALLQFAAEWGDDAGLRAALDGIGPALDAAWALDWSAAVDPVAAAQSLFVLGRGTTLGIAGEAALKLKEVAGIHAEAFSSAEVAHGPMTLVGPRVPVLVFAPRDAAREGLAQRIAAFVERGATVIASGAVEDIAGASLRLPGIAAHPLVAPLAQVASFYRLAEAVARARGRDPDNPPYLAKVTRTL